MYTTLEYYSTVFPYIYINMIKVGELSGTLEESLEQAVKYLEKSCLKNTTYALKPITFEDLTRFAEEASKEEEEKANSVNKI